MVVRAEKTKQRRSAVRGITGISVSGYKSLSEERHIDIRRLTILAGANSSGKSSIMQPLLLLKQTLEAPYDPGALNISGPNVQLTALDQFFSKLAGKPVTDTFSVQLEVDRSRALRITFGKHPRRTIEIQKMIYEHGKKISTIERDMSEVQIRKELGSEFDDFVKMFAEGDEKALQWKVIRNRCFLAFATWPRKEPKAHLYLPVYSPGQTLEEDITSLVHVPGLRANPERTYKTSAIGATFPGTFDDYVASVVHHWKSESDQRLVALGNALNRLGLTWKVDTRRVDDTRVEVLVGRLPHPTRGGARAMVSIADVGFGVSQSLPVVVSLLAAEPGQLVYVEQPETHLHPRAQVALAELFADATNRGVRIVIETHSPALLLAIQTLVAEGRLAPERVKLHWFTRRVTDGVTEVTSADLDASGAFGDWPEDFGDVELQAESRYLDATRLRAARR